MNSIKSIFISITPIWLVITIATGIQLLIQGKTALGMGLVLAAAPLAVFLTYILLFKSLARTGKHLWPVQLTSLSGLILCLLSLQQPSLTSIELAIVSYLSTLVYIYWYSDNGRLPSKQLAVGENLPDFSAIDTDGNTVTSVDLRQQATILMFTRGNWCPLCMAQIDEVANAYKKLNQLGVQVVIMASQPEKNTQSLAKKFNVPFVFLIDQDQKIGKKLGLIHHNGLPLGFQVFGHQNDQYYPTVIATDDSGKIIYSDQTSNYRIRPEPKDLIKLYQ